MNFSKSLVASTISLALLGLAGCSDSDSQDTQENDETSFTGLIIDGRIARGFVWLDTDNDNIIDTHEPYAYTDANGYFGYNPLTNTDYCVDETDSPYCLNTAMSGSTYSLKIAGGIDLGTGEPFDGIMVLTGALDDAKEVQQQVEQSSASTDNKPDFIPVISPLTSLVAGSDPAQQVELLTALGLEGIDLTNIEEILFTDYTDFAESDDASASDGRRSASSVFTASNTEEENLKRALFGYAFQYQKTIDTITTMVNDYLELLGISIGADDSGNPGVGSASAVIGQKINDFIASADLDPTENLLTQITQDDIATIINGALDELITDSISNIEMPDDTLAAINDTVQTVTTTIVDTVLAASTEEELRTSLIATQTLVTSASELAEDILSGDSAAVQDALDTIEDVAEVVQSDEFQDLVTDVAENNQTLDVKQLSDDILELEDGDSLSELVANATLAEAPAEGESGIWAQRVLSMSGQSEDGDASGRVLIFFDADSETSTNGDVTICYAYNSSNDDDDISATLIEGTWQELNARGVVQLNQDLISFTIKAQKQAVIPQEDLSTVVGLSDSGVADPDALYGHLRFSSDDTGSAIWFSDVPVADASDTQDFGLTASASVPTTPEQCESFTVNGVENALLKNLGF